MCWARKSHRHRGTTIPSTSSLNRLHLIIEGKLVGVKVAKTHKGKLRLHPATLTLHVTTAATISGEINPHEDLFMATAICDKGTAAGHSGHYTNQHRWRSTPPLTATSAEKSLHGPISTWAPMAGFGAEDLNRCSVPSLVTRVSGPTKFTIGE